MFAETISFPSPLAGEGAERAFASEAGEGLQVQRARKAPSPGSISRRSIFATLSHKGRGKNQHAAPVNTPPFEARRFRAEHLTVTV